MNLATVERVCMWTGTAVLSMCALGVIVLSVWAGLEVLLSAEDRICKILMIQKPMFNYLKNHKLYERLMDEYKAEQQEGR